MSSRAMGRLGLLFILYLVQGLPFGFQARVLPAYLREAGQSLTIITFTILLSLPWVFKVLWAPWVDRDTSSSLGRRRRWILPMQVVLIATCAAAAMVQPDDSLVGLLALVFVMNLCTATMDIAVDGLAVDILEPGQLGYGNIAQVVGYKVGMILSGGLLLAYADDIGWSGMFLAMGGLVTFGFAAMLAFHEPEVRAVAGRSVTTIKGVIAVARQVLWTPGARALLVLIITYKLGESMADVLFVPFLIDSGFTKGDIGLWLGTYGMVASIVGSAAGGVISARLTFIRAVALLAALRVVPMVGQLWLTTTDPSAQAVIVVTMAESLFGGALTTAMFALMMSRVDRRIGATHYTALATVEVLGKGVTTLVAGPMADATNYTAVYTTAMLLSIGFLAVLVHVSGRLPPAGDAP